MIAACVINGDPNLMTTCAELCTDLNSDENPDMREEPQDEADGDDDGGDVWEEDWDIGKLSDEDSDAEQEELPAAV
ncbi:hypothetical protein PI124_g4275 [Phytophthora idaei]|nr:hypothetical protein PI125_g3407 [Phytophthora idaei]KAG3164468.1 hypothetical protein PI126_g5084 [Phytophthora idaei]KAG3251119.1 hypothetical protein PI124_g4275 [Phytophthora idaei]